MADSTDETLHVTTARPAAAASPMSIEDAIGRYDRLVASAIRRVLGHHADVDDLMQETWITYLRCGHQVTDAAALGGWLFRVATRLAIRSHRRSARSVPHADLAHLSPQWVEAATEADILRAQRRAAVATAAALLRDRERQVVELLFDDADLGYREISDRLGVPVGSVGPTRERVIRRLRALPAVQRLGDVA